LPDDTPIDCVRFPTRIRNVLAAAGLKSVGEIRDTADKTLLMSKA
jgi:DNA-directed RNA polymerase alpha subunit